MYDYVIRTLTTRDEEIARRKPKINEKTVQSPISKFNLIKSGPLK